MLDIVRLAVTVDKGLYDVYVDGSDQLMKAQIRREV